MPVITTIPYILIPVFRFPSLEYIELIGFEKAHEVFRQQLSYFKDINYSEEVVYMKESPTTEF